MAANGHAIMTVAGEGAIGAPVRLGKREAARARTRDAGETMNPNSTAPTESSAEELAALCQRGDLESFDRLVGMFEDRIFSFLRRLSPNEEDAKDLTQETFLKAFRSLASFSPSRPFAPWLFTIARRAAASHFRSNRRFEELGEECGADPENPSGLLQEKDDRASLWKLARNLKPKQHEALWLRYGEGFSIAEIARIMNSNQIYVKVLLHRARTSLGKRLAGESGGTAIET